MKEADTEEKKPICFVIMPISDVEGYQVGHFKRVYKHLIEPSCDKAGFRPVRADDVMKTNHIILDVLRQLLKSDMAICDLSSKNPNVLYELGIRQAFNKPVTLIKDTATERIFDIQGIRDIEYDDALRVDRVEEAVGKIAETLSNTYEARQETEEINSIVKLLGIEPAKVEAKEISTDTQLILDALKSLDNKVNDRNRRVATPKVTIGTLREMLAEESPPASGGDSYEELRGIDLQPDEVKQAKAIREEAIKRLNLYKKNNYLD